MRGRGIAGGILGSLLLLASLATVACESADEKCKKACHEKVAACATQPNERARIDCEVKETPPAIACADACPK